MEIAALAAEIGGLLPSSGGQPDGNAERPCADHVARSSDGDTGGEPGGNVESRDETRALALAEAQQCLIAVTSSLVVIRLCRERSFFPALRS